MKNHQSSNVFRLAFLFVCLVVLSSCASNMPVSDGTPPSESQGACPNLFTVVSGEAQPGARITTHLTENGQLLGTTTVRSDRTFNAGTLTSGYNYSFAISGRRGGYEVQHHNIACGRTEFDLHFLEYVWDPSRVRDLIAMGFGLNWCSQLKGTAALCPALVYNAEEDRDWIDGTQVENLYEVVLNGVKYQEGEPYSAVFLDHVQMHDPRVSDKTIGGPDGPYGDISAFFLANTEWNRQVIDDAIRNYITNPIDDKCPCPDTVLNIAKVHSIHRQYINDGDLIKWSGIPIAGPAYNEKKHCAFLDPSCIPFVDVRVNYVDYPLVNWCAVKETYGQSTSSVLAIFYEHDSDQDDIIDYFVIDEKDDEIERAIPNSHLFRFVNRSVGSPDCDGDSVVDRQDNCSGVDNQGQADLDGDGIGDVCDDDMDGDGVLNDDDNCPAVLNPDQGDNEPTPPGPDGVGDACDNDDDDDGIPDVDDNCDFTQNPGQEDLDSDGIGDACDGDVDGDGVADAADNCPQTPNALQEDNEGDGLGDVCDDDDDDDGTDDFTDNCPLDANPFQEDYDQDGIGDICDDDVDDDGALNVDDCDPDNERVYPGATEVCDGLDNDCDGILETGCGATFALQTSELEAYCHAQFVCCYPCSCDPRDTDETVNSSVAEGTVQVQCEAEASGPGGGPGCSGDGYARAKIVRTYSSSGTSASLTLDTDENESGGGCGGHNEADANVTVDVTMNRTGTWAPGEGPTVTIEATDTTRPMTILRGGIPTGETLPAGSVSIDVVLDSPLEFTAHVDGDAEGQWTFTVSD